MKIFQDGKVKNAVKGSLFGLVYGLSKDSEAAFNYSQKVENMNHILAGKGEGGPAGRTYSGANNIRYFQWMRPSFGKAHSIMYTEKEAFQQWIPKLLKEPVKENKFDIKKWELNLN